MIRALLIFALTFAVAAPVIIIDADTSVDTVEVARTILVIFPGGLISALLYWRHHLSGKCDQSQTLDGTLLAVPQSLLIPEV